MSLKAQRPPVGASAANEVSLLGGNSSFSSAPAPKTQVENEAPCPIVLASHCRLTADLLGEAMEYAVTYGAAVLAGVREHNDAAILESFRHFDAAASCAKLCAEELRAYRGLLEAGDDL